MKTIAETAALTAADLRRGPSTSFGTSEHLMKYQALCNRGADTIDWLLGAPTLSSDLSLLVYENGTAGYREFVLRDIPTVFVEHAPNSGELRAVGSNLLVGVRWPVKNSNMSSPFDELAVSAALGQASRALGVASDAIATTQDALASVRAELDALKGAVRETRDWLAPKASALADGREALIRLNTVLADDLPQGFVAKEGA